jgi:hypothetical protein
MSETAGKVHQTPGNMRLTIQPGLGNGMVWRKSGVDRKSERVLAQDDNFAKRMAGKKIASECKGKPRAAFFSCLRQAGRRAYGSK